MNSQETMRRLRAARPQAHPSTHDDGLFARLVAAPGDPRLRRSSDRRSRLTAPGRRPRLLAGGSLGIAGVIVALTLVFSGGTASPAFAVTRQADGTVLVTLSNAQAIVGADEQLEKMGIREQVNYQTAPGAAQSSAPVACKLVLGPGDYTAAPTSKGPRVKMRLGTDNTGSGTIVAPDGNSGASGTVHLASCVSYPEGPGTELGNSGQAFLNAHGGS